MTKWNNYTGDDFTFVVCAYKECPYLESCIVSLVEQTVKTKVLISTSTPNRHISEIAGKYNIPIKVNPDGGQIKDYNFAMKQGETKLIMLAHQDEILKKTFVEDVLIALNHSKDPIIAFTDYIEMHEDKVDNKQSLIIRIKKLMLIPTHIKGFMYTIFGKRFIQLLGNPITHPTVVCVKEKMPKRIFREQYKASMDWDLWERLSRKRGTFVYVDKILLYHRMNDDNQSSVLIKTSNERYENEYKIFCRFWPAFVSKIIMKLYSKAHSYY